MRKAFTLIELLVVIAIIAILAAILFPVFTQAKAAAKKSVCLDNQRQIGMGLYLYLADSDDVLPMANYDSAWSGPGSDFSFLAGGSPEPAWADLIQPYTKSYNVFLCPTDNSGPYINPATSTKVPGYPLSYALNYYFYRRPDGFFGGVSGGSLSDVTAPSQKLFVVESASNLSREIVNPASNRATGLFRHDKGGNYVYADTHAHYHRAPVDWTTIPTATWGNPTNAVATGYNQWFPWVEGPEKW